MGHAACPAVGRELDKVPVRDARGVGPQRVGEGTFAEVIVNGEVAPIPAVRDTMIEPRNSP